MATSYTLTTGSTKAFNSPAVMSWNSRMANDTTFFVNKRFPENFLKEPPSRTFYNLLLESYNIRWQQQISLSHEWDKQHRHELVALRTCVVHKNCVHNMYIACSFLCLDHYRTIEDAPLPADMLNRYLERMFL